MNRLNKLKKNYNETEIPSELEDVVKLAIQQAKTKQKKRPLLKHWTIGIAAAAALFVGSINVSPAFAQSMANIPVLGAIVEVFTVQQLTVDEDTYQADLETPAVEGLADEGLQTLLNEKYIKENKVLYEQFQQEVADLKEAGGGHLGVSTGYEIKTDNDQLLSIGRYEVNTVGSSSTTMKYDTIDKQNSILITLPSLFKDEQYTDVISEYILTEMERKMKENEMNVYFFEYFDKIRFNQSFYITANNKLVISFDKYEVAPGYMGVVEFEIPTDVLRDYLVSEKYIK